MVLMLYWLFMLLRMLYTELLSKAAIAVLYREYNTADDQSESRTETNRFLIIFMYMCSVCSGMIYLQTTCSFMIWQII